MHCESAKSCSAAPGFPYFPYSMRGAWISASGSIYGSAGVAVHLASKRSDEPFVAAVSAMAKWIRLGATP